MNLEFELRDVMQDPLTPEELWELTHDARGRQLGPLTKVGSAVVMGFDPIRLGEYLEQYSEARTGGITVYGRPEDEGVKALLKHVQEQGVPVRLVDANQQPLTREELWELLEIPGHNIRTPFTIVDGTVVLGNDRSRLEQALAAAGYR